eukprot:15441759-Alexandrium_andersonii.AAC.1
MQPAAPAPLGVPDGAPVAPGGGRLADATPDAAALPTPLPAVGSERSGGEPVGWAPWGPWRDGLHKPPAGMSIDWS